MVTIVDSRYRLWQVVSLLILSFFNLMLFQILLLLLSDLSHYSSFENNSLNIIFIKKLFGLDYRSME